MGAGIGKATLHEGLEEHMGISNIHSTKTCEGIALDLMEENVFKESSLRIENEEPTLQYQEPVLCDHPLNGYRQIVLYR